MFSLAVPGMCTNCQPHGRMQAHAARILGAAARTLTRTPGELAQHELCIHADSMHLCPAGPHPVVFQLSATPELRVQTRACIVPTRQGLATELAVLHNAETLLLTVSLTVLNTDQMSAVMLAPTSQHENLCNCQNGPQPVFVAPKLRAIEDDAIATNLKVGLSAHAQVHI